jgi:hypothetical protein
MNRRRVALGTATVLLLTLVASRPAVAAGDTYTWVAADNGYFSVATNWQRASDGQPGVPGPDDAALISGPGTVYVTSPTHVSSVTVAGPVGGRTDLSVYGAGSLEADVIDITGELYVDAPVRAGSLRVTGHLQLEQEEALTLVADTTTDPPRPGRLVLDSATMYRPMDLRDQPGPVSIEVLGPDESSMGPVFLDEGSVDLTAAEGAVLTGEFSLSGSASVIGDVPEGATVSFGESEPSASVWSGGPDTVLGGRAYVYSGAEVTLPEQLTVTGTLFPAGGRAMGGTVEVTSVGRLHILDANGNDSVPELDLSGSLLVAADRVYMRTGSRPCIGEENLLARVDGTIGFPTSDIQLAFSPSGLRSVPVVMRHEVAIAYRSDGESTDHMCSRGRHPRLVRSMYRDLLGRVGDASGVSFWSGKLDRVATPGRVATSLLATPQGRDELVRSTFETWSCAVQPPSALAVAMGSEFLRAGGSLVVLRAEVVASTARSHGDPVVCLYRAALGRTPDPAGRAYVESRLESESVQKVARRLMTTSEGRRVQLHRLHRRLLARAAERSEVTAGTRQLAAGVTEQTLTARLAGSDEYRVHNGG